jgi:hypothetical protein
MPSGLACDSDRSVGRGSRRQVRAGVVHGLDDFVERLREDEPMLLVPCGTEL